MHPGFMHWWKEAQRQSQHAQQGGECGAQQQQQRGWHGHGHRERAHDDDMSASEDGGGGGFGVRRPLRFMAHRLELDEKQVTELAAVLDELKTERLQASVDHRRSVGSFADALAGDAFDEASATKAADARVKSSERLRDAVVKALKRTHAMLDAEQRKQLSYLLRSGQLTI